MTDPRVTANRQAIEDYEMATKEQGLTQEEFDAAWEVEVRKDMAGALLGIRDEPAHGSLLNGERRILTIAAAELAELNELRTRCSVLERERDEYAFDHDVIRFALNVPKDMALVDYMRDRLIPELSALRSKYEEARRALERARQAFQVLASETRLAFAGTIEVEAQTRREYARLAQEDAANTLADGKDKEKE